MLTKEVALRTIQASASCWCGNSRVITSSAGVMRRCTLPTFSKSASDRLDANQAGGRLAQRPKCHVTQDPNAGIRAHLTCPEDRASWDADYGACGRLRQRQNV